MGIDRETRSPGDPQARGFGITRRDAVGRLLGCATLAHPFGWRALAVGPQVLASTQELQPFVAGVMRLVEAMA